MGQIFIEGLGRVAIKGDVPDEIESQAILDAIADPEDEGDIFAIPPSVNEQPAVPTPEGPLGIMPREARGEVRKAVAGQPGLIPLLAEMSPSIGGAVAGASIGSIGGPVGILAGGIIGGLGGELVAQETGVAPRSDLNLALSAGGPLIGGAIGKGLQAGRRVVGAGVSKLPFAKAARAKNVLGKAVGEIESLGTRIIGKQVGTMARTAKELYSAVRRSGLRIKPNELSKTRSAITELQTELQPLAPFPEVRQAMKVLDNVKNTILGGTPTLDEVVRARSLIGSAVAQAEKKGGVRFGSAKKVFAQLSDDLDKIAASPFRKGRQGRLAKAAVARARLDFSVKELEQGVARFTKDVPDGMSINIKGFQKWLRDITNPKHANFNNNFSAALKDEIPAIKTRVAELAKIASAGSPGGPASLVVRGQTAKFGRALVGGLFGAGLGGAFGAGAGAVVFANAPEMFVAALTTKLGAAFLERAVRLGKGQISQRAWQALGQILTRSSGERGQSRSVSETLGIGGHAPVTLETQKKTEKLAGLTDLEFKASEVENRSVVTDTAVAAIIQQESGGDPNVVSKAGAIGLAQIMPATAKDPGFGVTPVDDPKDPKQARRFIKEYLGAMLERYDGDYEAALVAYNWGPGNADRWVKQGKRKDKLPKETRNYVKKLLPQVKG